MSKIECSIPTIEITIDFSLSGSDPGEVPNPAGPSPNGPNHQCEFSFLKPVQVKSNFSHLGPDSLIEVTAPETKLVFSFANAREGADPQFTGFRYYNTGDKWWAGGWWTPGHPGAKEFKDLEIDSCPAASMTVIDRTHNHTLYIYVVEWSEIGPDGNRVCYCCDPKIKNQPSGGPLLRE